MWREETGPTSADAPAICTHRCASETATPEGSPLCSTSSARCPLSTALRSCLTSARRTRMRSCLRLPKAKFTSYPRSTNARATAISAASPSSFAEIHAGESARRVVGFVTFTPRPPSSSVPTERAKDTPPAPNAPTRHGSSDENARRGALAGARRNCAASTQSMFRCPVNGLLRPRSEAEGRGRSQRTDPSPASSAPGLAVGGGAGLHSSGCPRLRGCVRCCKIDECNLHRLNAEPPTSAYPKAWNFPRVRSLTEPSARQPRCPGEVIEVGEFGCVVHHDTAIRRPDSTSRGMVPAGAN